MGIRGIRPVGARELVIMKIRNEHLLDAFCVPCGSVLVIVQESFPYFLAT